MYFSLEDINELEHLYKINLINSVSGFKPANLIATKSNDGIENVAVFSSVVHYGSNPPILGFVLRPTTVPRNTYDNIKASGVYTINHIHKGIVEEAHHTSAKYPKEISEFSKTNLESEYKASFDAPFVKGCKIQMAMEWKEEHHIKVNDTILLLGEVKHLFIDDEILVKDGFVDLTKANTVAINGLDAYASIHEMKRYPYQRPKKCE